MANPVSEKSSKMRSLLWPTIGSLATGFLVFSSVAHLHQSRRKYNVHAPDIDIAADAKVSEQTRAEWKRIYRSWMNTIEWIAIAQPIFWVSSLITLEAYGANSKPLKVVSACSVIWPLARFGYSKSYQKAASKRGPYFGISALCVLVSLCIGVVSTAKVAKKK
eukprot:749869_1